MSCILFSRDEALYPRRTHIRFASLNHHSQSTRSVCVEVLLSGAFCSWSYSLAGREVE